jgi:hypothetical protein
MTEKRYPAEQVATIMDYVDVEAPPIEATAHFIFGTNQSIPADLVIDRYHKELAPFVITTGSINRHNGINEGQRFRHNRSL